jgi:predicted RNA-binding protein with RPS1 domain
LRKLQRYILKYINYIPKHLIEFIVSPSLIEEIMAKIMVRNKNETIEASLKALMNSPELYQVNSEARKAYLYNYKRVMFNHYLFSIKCNK